LLPPGRRPDAVLPAARVRSHDFQRGADGVRREFAGSPPGAALARRGRKILCLVH